MVFIQASGRYDLRLGPLALRPDKEAEERLIENGCPQRENMKCEKIIDFFNSPVKISQTENTFWLNISRMVTSTQSISTENSFFPNVCNTKPSNRPCNFMVILLSYR